MKVRDCITMIEADGWYLVATRGSHRQYKASVKTSQPSVAQAPFLTEHRTGRITIAGHPADKLAPGTLNSVLKQAGLKTRDE
ncbi:addiction module toxin, HicA family [Methanoculleus sp. Wushi-C6]|uniref:Addiction module toxin, HicA family n=2 Tax=Methanoculleus caldifontis TaxID=2651577 RepID=A0ABU3X3V3_9EURY|nr:addiction module toxin, HicA family [Methanoculleus sp. Wushi-C6]